MKNDFQKSLQRSRENELSNLYKQGDAADPRDIARARAAVDGGFGSDALVTEAIRHGWLIRQGRPLDSCACVSCRARCSHGKGMNDYCKPCGRIHGGG